MAKEMTPKTLADLKAASYNPREITDKQLKQLGGSIERFGDLSGITFNVKSGVLVTGHQRKQVLSKMQSKIVREERMAKPDKTIKVPYREVSWDAPTEYAANIAANAAGGSFEMVKLGKLLKQLEKQKFKIEDVPMDDWERKKAITLFESSQKKGAATTKKGSEFETVDPKAMKFENCCPKCQYKW